MTKHHLDGFRSIQVMLRAPEHPLDAFIASTGRFCSETDHRMYRFSESLPHGVLPAIVNVCTDSKLFFFPPSPSGKFSGDYLPILMTDSTRKKNM
jgi:hypothetical protein